jgi:hypothetical protein
MGISQINQTIFKDHQLKEHSFNRLTHNPHSQTEPISIDVKPNSHSIQISA